MCQSCGGTCGAHASRQPKRTTIDVNMGSRKLRFVVEGGKVIKTETRA